jgi:hypothetical protein
MPLPMAKPTTSATATIPAGSALSNAVDLSSGALQMLLCPVSWTPAYITFQVSPDNVTWGDLFDKDGSEVSRNVRPGSGIHARCIAHAIGAVAENPFRRTR